MDIHRNRRQVGSFAFSPRAGREWTAPWATGAAATVSAVKWPPAPGGTGFGLDHLPYGVFSCRGDERRIGTRIGDHVLDLRAASAAGLLPVECMAGTLNPLMAEGRRFWEDIRDALIDLLSDENHRGIVEPMLVPIDDVTLHLPIAVADYVDFYSSRAHAENLGRMFRPGASPLLPNWTHLPVGYHGRAGTVVVSGAPIRRPSGQRRVAEGVAFGPSERLDIELEMGFVVGRASTMGDPVSIDDAADHIFGLALINDWSARDIQAWEYEPLGPFLGKSFATSMSPWITPLAALEPFMVEPPAQDPTPLQYLRAGRPWGFDIDLEVQFSTAAMRSARQMPATVCVTNAASLYWTAAQQLAHMTVNGASLRTGDLFASGTISGQGERSYGSLIERSWNGARPFELPDGSTRTFLADGDEITLRATATGHGRHLEMGSVKGRITPAARGG